MSPYTLNLFLNARTPEELEAQLRSLRVALNGRINDLRDSLYDTRKTGGNAPREASLVYRIDFLDSVVEQMIAQEAEWMRKARVAKAMEG